MFDTSAGHTAVRQSSMFIWFEAMPRMCPPPFAFGADTGCGGRCSSTSSHHSGIGSLRAIACSYERTPVR